MGEKKSKFALKLNCNRQIFSGRSFFSKHDGNIGYLVQRNDRLTQLKKNQGNWGHTYESKGC